MCVCESGRKAEERWDQTDSDITGKSGKQIVEHGSGDTTFWQTNCTNKKQIYNQWLVDSIIRKTFNFPLG